MTEVAIWAYPWDVADLGPEALARDLKALGITTVSLATSYHAGRFLSPGNPRRRVTYPEDGTVYYRPDPAHWQGAEIQPLAAAQLAEGDMAAALGGKVGLSAWTVLLHNTRLGMAHPDHCLRTAHGDPQYYGLCPSSPAVQDYACRLVAEIAARGPDRIEIESPDFMGFSHGYHHEKDGLPVLPEDDFLLGLCFCRHCLSAATGAGIPAEEARSTVCRLLDAAFDRELPRAQFPDFPDRGLAALQDLPALRAFLDWRKTQVTGLMARLRGAAPRARLLLIDYEGSWWGGVDLAAIAPHVDGVVHCAYRTKPGRIAPALAEARAALGPGKTVVAGFLLFHPEIRDAADLAARIAEARPLADGFNFYNLGLVPRARLGWIAKALDR